MNVKRILFLFVLMSFPSLLWATRGSEDYGIVLVVMFMLYSLPMGLLLVSFIIYSIVILKSNGEPKRKRGRLVFIFSLILIIPTLILPILWMNWAQWKGEMIELMIGAFLPVFILAVISLYLSQAVKKRTRRA